MSSAAANAYTLKISGGDLVLNSKGRLEIVSGDDKILQDISIILQSLKGSYPFNTSFGTDLIGINGAGRDATLIRTRVKTALLSYPYIDTVDTIELSFGEDRDLTLKISCTLASGASINTTETIS